MSVTNISDFDCSIYKGDNSQLHQLSTNYSYRLILVTSGTYEGVVDNKKYILRKNDLFVVARTEQFDLIPMEDSSCLYILSISDASFLTKIDNFELEAIFHIRPTDFSHKVSLSDYCFSKLTNYFGELAWENQIDSSFYSLKFLSLLHCILIEIYRENKVAFPLLKELNSSEAVIFTLNYVSCHLSSNIRLESIADQYSVNRHTLTYTFHDFVGIAFKDYHIMARLAEAKKMLLTTDLSISDISSKIGYVNVNNFVQIFKEKENITPLQFRKAFVSADNNI